MTHILSSNALLYISSFSVNPTSPIHPAHLLDLHHAILPVSAHPSDPVWFLLDIRGRAHIT